jgi:hypothetical protein
MSPTRRLLELLLVSCACASVAGAQTRVSRLPSVSYARERADAPAVAFVGGTWWDGERFVPRTFYAVRGILRMQRPARVDSTVDLAGRWVIPPFGDARGAVTDAAVRDAYVREGTLYVQVLGDSDEAVLRDGETGDAGACELDVAVRADTVRRVRTARDFAAAVRGGAQLVAPMLAPEFVSGEERAYRIDDEVMALAAARGVVVVPAAATTLDRTGDDPDALARVQEVQRDNLRRLARHGVRLAVGRDVAGRTAREEFDALHGLGVLDARALLRAWTETPRAIYPGRRVGKLADGYEASFLALARDPLVDVGAVRDIALRVKQGCVLQ